MVDCPRRLLLIRLGSLGDVVLTTPVARAARRAFPDAHIAVMTGHPLEAIYAESPHVDEVRAFDRERLNHAPSEIGRAVGWIRASGFDVSVDLHRKHKTALLARAGGVSLRIGGTWLDTHRVASMETAHVSVEGLRALAPLGVHADDVRLEVHVSDEDAQAARGLLAQAAVGVGVRPVLGVFPGAGWRPKAWPIDRFAGISQRATAEVGADVVVVGAAKDRDLVDRLERSARCAATIGLPLGVLAGVLSLCDCVIASDSGPMHLAVAVGTPTVALFGPTSAARYGPSYDPHVVLADREWPSVEAAWCAVRQALTRKHR